jgi:ABC-type multidrug transport system fused ATPase/permease subunit
MRSNIRLFFHFLVTMFRSAGHSAAALFFWLITNSLLESIGLLLLIPLLHAAGVSGPWPSQLPAFIPAGFVHNRHFDPLLTVLVIYVALMSIKALVNYRASVYSSWFQVQFVARLRTRIYSNLLHSHWRNISSLRAPDVAYQLTTNMQHIANAAYLSMLLINNALLATVYIAFTIWIAPAIALILIPLGALLYPVLSGYYRGTAAEAGKLIQLQREHETKGQNFVKRFRQIRAFGNQESERLCYANVAHSIADRTVSVARHIAAAQTTQTISAVILLAVIVYIALRMLALGVADLLILLYAFFRLLPRLSQLQQNSQHVLAMMPAYRSLSEFQDSLDGPINRVRTSEVSHASSVEIEAPAIHSLTLGPTKIPGRLYLEENNTTLYRSQMSVLVGESGVGKSTLCDVLAGFLPGMEMALINGEKPDTQHLAGLFAQTIYLEQDTTIWQDTVRESLLWACPHAGESKLLHVIEQVGLDSFIARSPLGLDTPIGDSAHWLSGGEMKRLALAQVLLRSPQVIILDEFTANLDSAAEKRLLSLLSRLKEGRLILVVSHGQAAREFGDAVWELVRSPDGYNQLQSLKLSPQGMHDHAKLQAE